MRKVQKIALQSQALWKRLTSIFKDDWMIDDYPIRVRFQNPAEPLNESRRKLIPWIAFVVNRPVMSGTGNTRNAALEELLKNFDQFKATKPSLPRPGTKVPIEFAASARVGQHSERAKDFLKRVLGIDSAWISDQSSLWDFHCDQTNEFLTDEIRRIYGVDVSDITNGNLADIFDRILASRVVPAMPR
jgi:hypothetical protein